MNSVQIDDYQKISSLDYIDWDKLYNKTILITGGTGLIGSNLTNAFLYLNRQKKLNLKIILLVRNPKAAQEMFQDFDDCLHIVKYKLGEKVTVKDHVSYIVHGASPTNSKFFTEKPADTIVTNVDGVKAILEFAKLQSLDKLVYLSTMEVYGYPQKGHKVTEHELAGFDPVIARNSYPIAKIACEALCNSFFYQYGTPSINLRLTQTFGPGVKSDDGRVFAQFMRSVIEKKDIVLKSQGLTERSYLYTADAVSAIIIALTKGIEGATYTVANPDTYCSIRDMANLVANEIAEKPLTVIYDVVEDITKLGYAETLYMDLDVTKLQQLGWKPSTGLKEMFHRMLEGMYTMSNG